MDFDNLREVLEVLFDYNNQKTGFQELRMMEQEKCVM